MRRAMRALFCGICLAVALVPVGSATAAFPGTNGKIAFQRSDSESRSDIWVMEADGSGQTNLTNSTSISEGNAKWSADGTRIAFERTTGSITQIYTMLGDGSDLQQVTNGSYDLSPSWSPDGERLVFIRFDGSTEDLYTINADGTDLQRLTTGLFAYDPAWSPDGSRIAYAVSSPLGYPRDLFTIDPAGGVPQQLTNTSGDEAVPDWSPDSKFLVFQGGASSALATIRRDGTDRSPLPAQSVGWFQPVWSPDGNRFAVSLNEIATINQIGSDAHHLADAGVAPDWQAVQPPPPPDPGYARPKGATPLLMYLVPAYETCSSPNREHGPPLAFGSCAPPTQSSQYLTVGTADSNGHATRFVGSVRLDTVVGNPSTPADEADVALRVDIADVLCAVDLPSSACSGALSDYAGELQGSFTARITDRFAGFSENQPGTLGDLFQFPFTISCAATPDPGTGGACALVTSFDALVPGVIKERKRTIWQVGQIEVRDGGEDGAASSDDNTVFAKQGVFVP